MSNAQKALKPLPGLSWHGVDIEQFRGEGLSFPTTIRLIIAPAFVLFTLGTARNFIQYYTGTVLDTDGDGFEIAIQDKITVDGETVQLGAAELGIELTYISGDQIVLLVDPTPTSH